MPRTASVPGLEQQLSSMIARVENLERARPAPPTRSPNPTNTASGSWTGDVRSGTLAPSGSVGGAWQTNSCFWTQSGNLVQFRYYMLWGMTGVVNGSGTYAFMLPALPQFRNANRIGNAGLLLGPCSFISAPLSQRFEIDSADIQTVAAGATPWFSCGVIVGTTRNSVGYSQPFSTWSTARPEFLFTASFLTTAIP